MQQNLSSSLLQGTEGEGIVNVPGVEWRWGLKESEIFGQSVIPTTEKSGCSNNRRIS